MSNYSDKLPDVQHDIDPRGIEIDNAGICDLIIPISVKRKNSEINCDTVATVKCAVKVPSTQKGTNMSRLPIYIQTNTPDNLTLNKLKSYCSEICKIAETEYCSLEYDFPYFLMKNSPVEMIPGLVHYKVNFYTDYNSIAQIFTQKIKVSVIASTCCPCSKLISAYNAHNQKCYIDLEITLNQEDSNIIWLEDLIKICEDSASCEIYSILKRPDEKFVTEKMYDRPRFVEDVVREVCVNLKNNYNKYMITDFKVKATADESIHMHKAIASISGNFSKLELIKG